MPPISQLNAYELKPAGSESLGRREFVVLVAPMRGSAVEKAASATA